MSEHVYIGIGSNLKNPIQQVESAVHALKSLPQTTWIQRSSWYESKPIGPNDQPNYINGVAHIKTSLTPNELLSQLHHIENDHGRTRDVRWGARTLDLDILVFGQQTLNTDSLTIPHKELPNRNFVVIPLWEITPDLCVPNVPSLDILKDQLGMDGLQKR